MEIREFNELYWNNFLLLEQEFLATTRFVEIDEINFNTYSREYFKLIQAIGSEVDVVCKLYCKLLDNKSKADNINQYCKIITDNDVSFNTERIWNFSLKKDTIPWENWNYSIVKTKDGKDRIVATQLDWWNIYNKTKHNRTSLVEIETHKKEPYFKLANQKNTINILAALYCLEMKCYLHLIYLKLKEGFNIKQLSIKKSVLFHLRDLIAVIDDNDANRFLWYSKQINVFLHN